MTTDDSKAALAAALYDLFAPDDHGSLTADPRRREYWEGRAAAIFAALDGWTLVNDEDFHAELTDDELAVCAAMNFGEGKAEGRKEGEAKVARLTAALRQIAATPKAHKLVASICEIALAPKLDDIHGTPTFSEPPV